MDRKYQIDKNIPVPTQNSWGFLKNLRPGDSIVIATQHYDSVASMMRKLGMRPVRRKIDKSTLRVWRAE